MGKRFEDDDGYSAQKATVRVLEPCDCKQPWWKCVNQHDTLIAEYDVPGYDWTSAPHPDAVKDVQKLHPGKTLVYIKF